MILDLNPTLVLLLALVLYKRPIAKRQALGMSISYAGVLLVFGHEATLEGADILLGGALVLASTISYSVYLTFSGELVKRLGSLRLVGLATSVACILCLVQFVILRPFESALVAPQVIWLSLLNATLCTAAPVLMVMMAIERIGAGLASQTGMVGPVSTILMGVLLLGEPFTVWVAAGTCLVIAGIFVVTGQRRTDA